MFVLGFDFGIKYIGVAIGDFFTYNTSPLFSVVINDSKIDYNDIFYILDFWQPLYIVIGYPLSEFYDNSMLLNRIDLFAFKIRCFYNGHVIFVDENLSSWKARRILNLKKNRNFFTINALSAAILIEQCFLDNLF
ncbi:MAG TPA: Holliday junction resolvase RuvX [Candidatus Azoamicus sp.]